MTLKTHSREHDNHSSKAAVRLDPGALANIN